MINPMQMMGNPEQFVMGMLESTAQSNPIAKNLLNLARQGDGAQIEQIARNMAKEKGIDFDTEFNNFKHRFGF